jgi:collagen type I alpha
MSIITRDGTLTSAVVQAKVTRANVTQNIQFGDELLRGTIANAGTLSVNGIGGPLIPLGAILSEFAVRCFVAGTRIATQDGEQPVETLRVGDIVRVSSGEAYPIVWIGRRHIDLQRHPAPERARPVRIAAGAFGRGCPHTDLRLSPNHAVYINEVLIPIRYLINDHSITQLDADDVTYYHVELTSHQLLLAEGLAVESYLDTGDRSVFERGAAMIDLYPDFYATQWKARGYAPLTLSGPELERARQTVARFATRAVRAQKRRISTGSTSHSEREASARATSRVTPISASIWSDNSGNA